MAQQPFQKLTNGQMGILTTLLFLELPNPITPVGLLLFVGSVVLNFNQAHSLSLTIDLALQLGMFIVNIFHRSKDLVSLNAEIFAIKTNFSVLGLFQ